MPRRGSDVTTQSALRRHASWRWPALRSERCMSCGIMGEGSAHHLRGGRMKQGSKSAGEAHNEPTSCRANLPSLVGQGMHTLLRHAQLCKSLCVHQLARPLPPAPATAAPLSGAPASCVPGTPAAPAQSTRPGHAAAANKGDGRHKISELQACVGAAGCPARQACRTAELHAPSVARLACKAQQLVHASRSLHLRYTTG